MNIQEFIKTFNEWGQQKIPFLFVIDYELQKPVLIKQHDIDPSTILFNINGFTNAGAGFYAPKENNTFIEKHPISVEDYAKKFDIVYKHLRYGDSYLANLTAKTEIKSSHSLRDLFFLSKAKYKLLFHDEFLVFSPETFIQVRERQIFSYPMKGTIDATVPHAREILLQDKKELAEHITIVDLIRNDLSQISTDVAVTRFRYIDEIKTNTKSLLQVSSEIRGLLPENYCSQLGTLLVSLLPAGSISGAPKEKTREIIKKAEKENRGYYTGIVGYFDGYALDSGVMIRYIENKNGLFYRSGGGITAQSNVATEYQEMIDKVYVPVD